MRVSDHPHHHNTTFVTSAQHPVSWENAKGTSEPRL